MGGRGRGRGKWVDEGQEESAKEGAFEMAREPCDIGSEEFHKFLMRLEQERVRQQSIDDGKPYRSCRSVPRCG
jgi:hypothetical protein